MANQLDSGQMLVKYESSSRRISSFQRLRQGQTTPHVTHANGVTAISEDHNRRVAHRPYLAMTLSTAWITSWMSAADMPGNIGKLIMRSYESSATGHCPFL